MFVMITFDVGIPIIFYRYHLKTFDKVATSHYVRGSQMFHTSFVKAPALFFVSKADSIGSVSANIRARDSWESLGTPVRLCFSSINSSIIHFQSQSNTTFDQISHIFSKQFLICV